MGRPDFEDIRSGEEFNQWYWLKKEMVSICKVLGLPSSGRKFDLRDRIMYSLDNEGALLPRAKPKKTSTFNWAKTKLTSETVITDNITFGQNLRHFMESEIGPQFSFNIHFMDWAKANTGKSLGDAVDFWLQMERRKHDPDFQTLIADNNMYNQYTRDFLADNPTLSPSDARKFWLKKKLLPMKQGFVRYHKDDLGL